MFSVTRREEIAKKVHEKKHVTVNELAKHYNVTEETIRRDLKVLEAEGLLTRTYGGAYVSYVGEYNVRDELDFSFRKKAGVASKKKIAKSCRQLLQNGNTVFLDASTTAYYVAQEISNMTITVVTTSMLIFNYLSAFKNITLISTGGVYDKTCDCLDGILIQEALKIYSFDKAFISCNSISIEKGITDSREESAIIRKLVLDRSKTVYCIADYTKFDTFSLIKICDVLDVSGLITDKSLDEKWQTFFKLNGYTTESSKENCCIVTKTGKNQVNL